MRILVATSNPHKLEEIEAVCRAEHRAGDADIEWISLAALSHTIDEPVEDQPTFEGNALLKARHYARASGHWCLADDSGLEVDALGGEPGVRSARYAGVTGPRSKVDPRNNMLLLERLSDTPIESRTARFVCAMALVAPHDDECRTIAEVRGMVEGRIILPEEASDPAQPHRGRGTNGFGYDPLFFVPQLGKTTAELTPEHKNRISHRGAATRLLLERLRAAFAHG